MQRYLGKRTELKIYISNEDTYQGKPLFEALLTLAKEKGLAGATLFKGVAGLGVHSQIHSFNVWTLQQKMPLLIIIIDTKEKIEAFLEASKEMIVEGLVTTQETNVVLYHHPKLQQGNR